MSVKDIEEKQSGSMEDYLERIGMLAGERGVVRVTELSKSLEVRKPSVTAAINKLSKKGLVNHERYGYVELTGEGKKVADDVFRRHEVLRKFLTEILGVASDIAWEEACHMEHFVSPSTIERLATFVEFMLTCPLGKSGWLKGFDYYLEHGECGEELLGMMPEGRRKRDSY